MNGETVARSGCCELPHYQLANDLPELFFVPFDLSAVAEAKADLFVPSCLEVEPHADVQVARIAHASRQAEEA